MREMKDSGIEWIGEIPADWELSKIGTVYEERNEKVSDADFPPLSVTKQGVVPQLETAAKTNDGDNRKLIRKNDFVINSRSDRRGACGISEYDGSCSLINTVLKPRRNMCNAYYSFVFRSERFADEFYRWGNGIVDDLWSTKWSNMKRIYIPVPSLQEQRCIADYLDRKCSQIDAIIAQQQKVIERLKVYKLSVITEAVTKGLNPNVPTKDSGVEWIGEIPEHWSESTILRNICFEGGSQPPLEYFIDEPREGYIRLIQNRDYRTDDYATYVPITMVSKFCTKEDVMIGRYGPPIFVIHRGLEGAYNVALMKAIPVNIDREFMFFYLQNSTLLKYIESFSVRTAGQSGVNPNILKRYPMFIPPVEEQQQIAKGLLQKCHYIDGLIANKKKLVEKLMSYKKSLIYEVVTGKKEV